ncbi:MAG: hypothetical protein PHH54_01780 [Candidatus Nanoarchaeia archaeon]|nr:hypothetical protein [Candidatus Nanoarchaeia archaeon]MDD5740692.1 hypothetical protein [Candidatus Nanoarchaeia archaeon]
MDFISTYKTIKESEIFKSFIEYNKEAELVAGFFILDLLENNNQRSLDYKLQQKIFTFSLDEAGEITMREDELIESDKPLEKISSDIKIDLDEIPEIAEKQAGINNIKNKFQKIIAVLQLHEGKQVWNLTCMLDSFVILNIIIDSETGDTLKFDKRSVMDFVKKK